MARLSVRVVVTVVVLWFWAALFWRPEVGSWRISAVPVPGRPHLATIGSTGLYRLPLPAEVKEGDLLDRRSLPPDKRLELYSELPAIGSELHLQLRRGNATRSVTLRAEPILLYGHPYWIVCALFMAYTLLGLVLLWRGRDWVAWGLSTFALAYAMKDVSGATLPPGPSVVLMIVLRAMRDLGLYIAILALARPGLPPRTVRISRIIMLTAVGAYLAAMLYDVASLVLLARYSAPARFIGDYGMTVASLITAVTMLLGYRHLGEVERLRVRWILAGTILHATGFVIYEWSFWLALSMALSAVLSFAYAALRHRLVDVSFAVSRTLVYGTVVLVVVGVFAVVEHAIAGQAIGKQAGLVLHLIVPLVLGITLHKLRERLEHLIERLFFHRQFEAERALLRLARESAYMEREDRLLMRTLHDIARHIRPGRVAVYQRRDGGYERVAQEGAPEWPVRIDADDPAFVSLRSGVEEQALVATDSVLGRGGMLFPMSVAGRVEGAIACGDRPQQYTRVERELLRRVAHEVGTARHGLRARRSEQLLEALARGTLTVREVREQALDASR